MTPDIMLPTADPSVLPGTHGSVRPGTHGSVRPGTHGSVLPGGHQPALPLGAFREMVERHLGRDLTDESGRDLATWLADAGPTPVGDDPLPAEEMTAASSMARLAIDALRTTEVAPMGGGDGATTPTAVAQPAGAAPQTLGGRIAAIARSIGLPVGSTQAAPAATSIAGIPSNGAADAASAPTTRLPASGRGEGSSLPFLPEPATVAGLAGTSGQTRQPPASATVTTADPVAAADDGGPPIIDLRRGSPFAVAARQTAAPPADALPPRAQEAMSGPSAARAIRDAIDAAVHMAGDAPDATALRPETVDVADPVRLDVESNPIAAPQDAAAGRALPDTPPGQRVQVPEAAINRVMRAIELQASAPPPRMAVVEIPEFDGLRIMVSIGDRGAVTVTPLGANSTMHAPFLQAVSHALEAGGFQLDDRRQSPERRDQDESVTERRAGRRLRRRAQRTDGLMA